MKAILIRKYGGPDVLEIAELPDPQPKDDEVVIQVAATSVNPVDWLVRDGGAKSWVRIDFPAILGCDLAGKVVATGAKAKRFAVGDEVFAMMRHDWGAHAERVALPESIVVKKPASLSMIEAAALPVVAMTALNGLKHKAEVRAGDRVLVNGASGGVGQASVQIAKVLGAHVTAVCGADSFDLVKRLGADEVIDYKTTDFTKIGKTWDVIFDCVGKKPYGECGDALGGRRVHVTTVPGLATMLRQLFDPITKTKVYGIVTTGNGEDLEFLKSLVDQGKLQPVVDKIYPFADVAAAQEYSKSGRAKGKIVLEL